MPSRIVAVTSAAGFPSASSTSQVTAVLYASAGITEAAKAGASAVPMLCTAMPESGVTQAPLRVSNACISANWTR